MSPESPRRRSVKGVKPAMRVRLRDIAEKTGFSINTVSLALKGSPLVREETRRRIVEAAKELNYVPNNIARSLVQRKTHTIGVILTDIMNPVLTGVAQHIERELMGHGYNIILMTTYNDPAHEAHAIDVLRSRQVDGILMYPVSGENAEKVADLAEAGFPLVLLAGGDESPQCNVISVDDSGGAYRATSHLVRLGHRRIAFINGGGIRGNEEKLRGYRRALAEAGISLDPALIVEPSGIGYSDGYHAARHLFQQKEPPTAVFASTDSLALGLMYWCFQQGLKVPEDVAIVGFDDIEAARFAAVPLTSVAYAVEVVASKAAARLLQLIDEADEAQSSEPVREVIEPRLIVRESCGARRMGVASINA